MTPQLDVYALGVLLWQMMAGRHPFVTPGMNMAMLVTKQLEEEIPSLAEAAGLPGYVDEVLRAATAKDSAQRYPGMWALAQGMLALRARLLADPEAAGWWEYTERERQCPITQESEGRSSHVAVRSLPGAVTVPPLASQRVVVAPELGAQMEERRVVAKTVPMGVTAPGAAGVRGVVEVVEKERTSAPTLMMAAPLVPAGVTGSGVDVGAPTVRGRARSRGRWVWVAVVAVVVVAAVVVWVLVGPR